MNGNLLVADRTILLDWYSSKSSKMGDSLFLTLTESSFGDDTEPGNIEYSDSNRNIVTFVFESVDCEASLEESVEVDKVVATGVETVESVILALVGSFVVVVGVDSFCDVVDSVGVPVVAGSVVGVIDSDVEVIVDSVVGVVVDSVV
jgi:hypothetical protein